MIAKVKSFLGGQIMRSNQAADDAAHQISPWLTDHLASQKGGDNHELDRGNAQRMAPSEEMQSPERRVKSATET